MTTPRVVGIVSIANREPRGHWIIWWRIFPRLDTLLLVAPGRRRICVVFYRRLGNHNRSLHPFLGDPALLKYLIRWPWWCLHYCRVLAGCWRAIAAAVVFLWNFPIAQRFWSDGGGPRSPRRCLISPRLIDRFGEAVSAEDSRSLRKHV